MVFKFVKHSILKKKERRPDWGIITVENEIPPLYRTAETMDEILEFL